MDRQGFHTSQHVIPDLIRDPGFYVQRPTYWIPDQVRDDSGDGQANFPQRLIPKPNLLNCTRADLFNDFQNAHRLCVMQRVTSVWQQRQ